LNLNLQAAHFSQLPDLRQNMGCHPALKIGCALFPQKGNYPGLGQTGFGVAGENNYSFQRTIHDAGFSLMNPYNVTFCPWPSFR
jgi:hypothetical protein